MKTTTSIKGKTFIVVGALGKLGSSISEYFIDQGANILAVDLAKEVDPKSLFSSNQYHYVSGDITNSDSLKSIFEECENVFKNIDGAINASYPKAANYGKKFFEVNYDDFCQNISVHIGGYFHFMQQCAKFSIDNERKFSLINFSSIYGVIPPRFDLYKDTDMTVPVEYAAMKSSIQHLTSYLTALTKGSNFRVNCISPGGILDNQDPVFLEKYKNYSRSKGMLDAQDLLGTVLYLSSDLSEYVCGQNIIVDDGFSV